MNEQTHNWEGYVEDTRLDADDGLGMLLRR